VRCCKITSVTLRKTEFELLDVSASPITNYHLKLILERLTGMKYLYSQTPFECPRPSEPSQFRCRGCVVGVFTCAACSRDAGRREHKLEDMDVLFSLRHYDVLLVRVMRSWVRTQIRTRTIGPIEFRRNDAYQRFVSATSMALGTLPQFASPDHSTGSGTFRAICVRVLACRCPHAYLGFAADLDSLMITAGD
jgi:hypothetical protein